MRASRTSEKEVEAASMTVIPVVLPGFWMIFEFSEDSVELVGQLDPEDGVWRMLRTSKAIPGR